MDENHMSVSHDTTIAIRNENHCYSFNGYKMAWTEKKKNNPFSFKR